MNEIAPQQFQAAAARANLLGIVSVLNFDHETTMSLASRFVDRDDFFLLESATHGPGQVARYSFLGIDKIASWSWQDNKVSSSFFAAKDQSMQKMASPILSMEECFSQIKVEFLAGADYNGPDLSSLIGASGFISYDVARYLEPSTGHCPPKELGLPDVYFVIPKFFLVLDHLRRQLIVIHFVRPKGEGHRSRSTSDAIDIYKPYKQAVTALNDFCADLQRHHQVSPLIVKNAPLNPGQWQNSIEKDKYLNIVGQCLDHIKNGDVFQIQIGNRISQESEANPFDIFRHLRLLNPSPYMFYFKLKDHILFGSSPEMMVGKNRQHITHRPIAGTRKRTGDFERDRRLKNELISSEKERAEHVMLVDLSRNDIGRLAQTGSIEVEQLMTVEQYSHVFHMVSQVTGRLSNEVTAGEVMSVSFPNGTVSGAPKIKAMELINRYETVAREFYAGSLALFTFNGDLNSTLLIRSCHVKDGIASTQASAGIVYDSTPIHEWEETQHKMAACLLSIQNTDR